MGERGLRTVLIVTYYWPPAGGPGVQRVVRFARYLPRFGWRPVILTVSDGDYPARDDSLATGIPAEVEVIRTPILEPYSVYRRLTGRSGDEQIPTYVLSRRQNEGVGDRVARWVRGNLFVPDARIGWIPWAVRAGRRRIAEGDIDLIFSTSPPHSLQLSARRLARRSRLPWVADFRDPWTEAFWTDDVTQLPAVRRMEAAMERRVLSESDAVVTVSQGLADRFDARMPNRYAVAQNGCEPLDDPAEPCERFRVLFIGHLSKHQPPDTVLAAAAGLSETVRKDLELCFVGRIFDGHRESFERHRDRLDIRVHPYMPHAELMRFARSASVLLRPVAQTSYAADNVGAKTSEYLSLRKPILTLGVTGSFSEMLLTETGSGELFDYGDVAGIRDFLVRWHGRWKDSGVPVLDNLAALRPYTTEHHVGLLAGLFDDLAAGS